MNAEEFATALVDTVERELDSYIDSVVVGSVASFESRGVLTRDAGLVVTLSDGSEFQITVVRSAPPRDIDDEEED